MSKQIISVPGAVNLPFSPAVRAGDFIFVAGQGGWRGPGTEGAGEGVEEQTKLCLENIKRILEAAGSLLDDVVKVKVFLTDAKYFQKMNEVYGQYFKKDLPARACIVTGLVLPFMLVEIECIAYSPRKG